MAEISGAAWRFWIAGLALAWIGCPGGSGSLVVNGLSPTWTPEYENITSYWPLDTNWEDSASAMNDGVPMDDAMILDIGEGPGGGVASFDGAGDYAEVGALGISGQGAAFTISMWVKPADIAAGKQALLVNGDSNDHLNKAYGGLHIATNGGNGSVSLSLGKAGIWEAHIYTGVVLADGAWTHIVGTYDGTSMLSGMKIYINGVAVAVIEAGAFGVAEDAWDNWTLGIAKSSFATTSTPFGGELDEVGIWPLVLSASQVETIFDRQTPTYP